MTSFLQGVCSGRKRRGRERRAAPLAGAGAPKSGRDPSFPDGPPGPGGYTLPCDPARRDPSSPKTRRPTDPAIPTLAGKWGAWKMVNEDGAEMGLAASPKGAPAATGRLQPRVRVAPVHSSGLSVNHDLRLRARVAGSATQRAGASRVGCGVAGAGNRLETRTGARQPAGSRGPRGQGERAPAPQRPALSGPRAGSCTLRSARLALASPPSPGASLGPPWLCPEGQDEQGGGEPAPRRRIDAACAVTAALGEDDRYARSCARGTRDGHHDCPS